MKSGGQEASPKKLFAKLILRALRARKINFANYFSSRF
jgi:hypothetical protein